VEEETQASTRLKKKRKVTIEGSVPVKASIDQGVDDDVIG
jgi:hypothetical protein